MTGKRVFNRRAWIAWAATAGVAVLTAGCAPEVPPATSVAEAPGVRSVTPSPSAPPAPTSTPAPPTATPTATSVYWMDPTMDATRSWEADRAATVMAEYMTAGPTVLPSGVEITVIATGIYEVSYPTPRPEDCPALNPTPEPVATDSVWFRPTSVWQLVPADDYVIYPTPDGSCRWGGVYYQGRYVYSDRYVLDDPAAMEAARQPYEDLVAYMTFPDGPPTDTGRIGAFFADGQAPPELLARYAAYVDQANAQIAANGTYIRQVAGEITWSERGAYFYENNTASLYFYANDVQFELVDAASGRVLDTMDDRQCCQGDVRVRYDPAQQRWLLLDISEAPYDMYVLNQD